MAKYKSKYNDHSDRLKRTRQLIQLGGLVSKVGIPELFDIEPGTDLEEDLTIMDKAATLLGFLYEAYYSISPTPENLDKWQRDGVRLLRNSYQRKAL